MDMNELIYGEAKDVYEYAMACEPPLDPASVRLVLINAMRRIAALEAEVTALRKFVGTPEQLAIIQSCLTVDVTGVTPAKG